MGIFKTTAKLNKATEEVSGLAGSTTRNYKFTHTVEKRVHKKGGDYINYSFMNFYSFIATMLSLAPGFAAFAIFGLLKLEQFQFLQTEVVEKIYLYEGIMAMAPHFIATLFWGFAASVIFHTALGIVYWIKFGIGMLFFDFFKQGFAQGIFIAAFWGGLLVSVQSLF